MRIEKYEVPERALSWVVALGMSAYGVGKYVQFQGGYDQNVTLSELSGMQLMWAFYGYSLNFALIIGFFELLSAALIFFKKTRLIGCFFLSPILVNIIIQDIIYEVHLGALITALIYQSFVFIIIYFNRSKIYQALKLLFLARNEYKNRREQIISISMSVILFLTLQFLIFWLI